MSILLSWREEFAIVTIDRPQALNALNYGMLHEIGRVLDEVESSEARAVFFIGAGDRAFCAGADIGELPGRTIPEEYAGTLLGQRLCSRIESFALPSIALVNGHALGGGCELALSCTFRLGSPSARFGLPEIKLGLVPGYGGTQRLPRLIGMSAALEMLMTGCSMEAEDALRLGLLSRLVSGDLLSAGIEFARGFTGHGLLALRMVRDAALRGRDLPLQGGLQVEADLSSLSFRSADGQEGLSAFIEKRKPVFRDR